MSPFISVRLLKTQSDERLLAAAREGHERAFETLVQRYRRPLLRYCRRLLLPEQRAEDALQQALLQAWLALQRGSEVRDAKAWLYRVVHHSAIDSLRISGYDHEQLSESLCGAGAPQSDLERRTAVRQALAGLAALPELQREAILRTAIQGHSHERVAAELGLSDGAVRGLVYRARATLRAAATALTPPPVFVWAASAGQRGAPLAQRFSEFGPAAGATGATGTLLKGGAVVLTAGALVAGAVTVPHHPANHRSFDRAGGSSAKAAASATAAVAGAAPREPRASDGRSTSDVSLRLERSSGRVRRGAPSRDSGRQVGVGVEHRAGRRETGAPGRPLAAVEGEPQGAPAPRGSEGLSAVPAGEGAGGAASSAGTPPAGGGAGSGGGSITGEAGATGGGSDDAGETAGEAGDGQLERSRSGVRRGVRQHGGPMAYGKQRARSQR